MAQGLVKRFFNEKEVTSTLVMDALFSGCKQVEEASRAGIGPKVCCLWLYKSVQLENVDVSTASSDGNCSCLTCGATLHATPCELLAQSIARQRCVLHSSHFGQIDCSSCVTLRHVCSSDGSNCQEQIQRLAHRCEAPSTVCMCRVENKLHSNL